MIKRFIASAVIFVAGFAFSSAMNGSDFGLLAKGLLSRADSPTIATQGALRGSQWEYALTLPNAPKSCRICATISE